MRTVSTKISTISLLKYTIAVSYTHLDVYKRQVLVPQLLFNILHVVFINTVSPGGQQESTFLCPCKLIIRKKTQGKAKTDWVN